MHTRAGMSRIDKKSFLYKILKLKGKLTNYRVVVKPSPQERAIQASPEPPFLPETPDAKESRAGDAYSIITLCAATPRLCMCRTSNSTRSPLLGQRFGSRRPAICRNTSAPPSSGTIKPQPSWSRKNFTVPVAITPSPSTNPAWRAPPWRRRRPLLPSPNPAPVSRTRAPSRRRQMPVSDPSHRS